jgi:hypothetical protein
VVDWMVKHQLRINSGQLVGKVEISATWCVSLIILKLPPDAAKLALLHLPVPICEIRPLNLCKEPVAVTVDQFSDFLPRQHLRLILVFLRGDPLAVRSRCHKVLWLPLIYMPSVILEGGVEPADSIPEETFPFVITLIKLPLQYLL